MATPIDGKAIAKRLLLEAKKRATTLAARGHMLRLVVVLVGNDTSSELYIRNKERAGKEIGIEVVIHRCSERATKKEMQTIIKKLQSDPTTSGLIVQLPLPHPADAEAVLSAIDPSLDVDCLTKERMGALVLGEARIVPPTPGAIFSILEDLGVKLPGKHVVIVGAGTLVGKPLTVMMMHALASVTVVNRMTKKIHEICRMADILVSGVGKKGIITGDMVKDNAILIDAGMSFSDGKMYGDIDIASLIGRDVLYTPTPGGLGPVTVARLLLNVVACAEHK